MFTTYTFISSCLSVYSKNAFWHSVLNFVASSLKSVQRNEMRLYFDLENRDGTLTILFKIIGKMVKICPNMVIFKYAKIWSF